MTGRQILAAAAAAMALGFSAQSQGRPDYPIKPVPFTAVHLADDFWARQRLLELEPVLAWPTSHLVTGFRRTEKLLRQPGPGASRVWTEESASTMAVE